MQCLLAVFLRALPRGVILPLHLVNAAAAQKLCLIPSGLRKIQRGRRVDRHMPLRFPAGILSHLLIGALHRRAVDLASLGFCLFNCFRPDPCKVFFPDHPPRLFPLRVSSLRPIFEPSQGCTWNILPDRLVCLVYDIVDLLVGSLNDNICLPLLALLLRFFGSLLAGKILFPDNSRHILSPVSVLAELHQQPIVLLRCQLIGVICCIHYSDQ